MLQEEDYLVRLFAFPRLRLQRAEGSWVYDIENKKYLDFTSGLAVMALGHARKDIADIMYQQYMQLDHCSNLFIHNQGLELAKALVENSFASRVWFCNSGAEANEAAMKFARLYAQANHEPQRRGFIAFKSSFHGRTMGAMSVTYEPAYREPFGPCLENVQFATFNDIDSVRALIDRNICGVIIEPVQGEGGVEPAHIEFLKQLRELCTQTNTMLIFDEIQCGMGRTGTLFAYEQLGVVPDMMTLAKPIAGGLPLGATLVNDAIAQLMKPGLHGSTFAGGPVTTAVGLHILTILNQPAFLQQVRETGALLRKKLEEISKKYTIFSHVRGMGLMQGLVVANIQHCIPVEFVAKCRQQGLLVSRAGKDTIRFLPPLNTTPEEIEYAMRILEQVAATYGAQS